MARLAVKLLLLDEDDRLLLIQSRDPQTQVECWYPVGGGIEPGETLQDAAAREAYEETGLVGLRLGCRSGGAITSTSSTGGLSRYTRSG